MQSEPSDSDRKESRLSVSAPARDKLAAISFGISAIGFASLAEAEESADDSVAAGLLSGQHAMTLSMRRGLMHATQLSMRLLLCLLIVLAPIAALGQLPSGNWQLRFYALPLAPIA